MSHLKRPALIASALISAVLLVGCSNEAAPDAAPSEPAPTTSTPTDEATPEAAPEQEAEEVEPLAAEPTPEKAEEEAPQESSVSPEERVIASFEEVMGEGACERIEQAPGTPLEEWSIDEYFIDETGELGALKGHLTHAWCVPTAEADLELSPEHLTVRFFTDQEDIDSELVQLEVGRTADHGSYGQFLHEEEGWTASAWGLNAGTHTRLTHNLGAEPLD